MAALPNIHVYSPEEMLRAKGRVIHSSNSSRPANARHRDDVILPSEREAARLNRSTHRLADMDFTGAEIPDIPLRRSSKMPVVGSGHGVFDEDDLQPTIRKRLDERERDIASLRNEPTQSLEETNGLGNIEDDDDVEAVVRRGTPADNGYRTPTRSRPSPSHKRSVSPMLSGSRSSSAASTYARHTAALPALQTQGSGNADGLEPLEEEDLDPGSFDLVAPNEPNTRLYSLERRSEQLFSREHLAIIFEEPKLLVRFTNFLSTYRPTSLPLLVYYLDALKALKAVEYSNAIVEALGPLAGHDFTKEATAPTVNKLLKDKTELAFQALVNEDLPAYITHTWTKTVSDSIQKRITGTLSPLLRDMSEGLAEVFCLTDPSKPDNPIIFASEEFHRTTQYGMNHVLGRNCRFLQGPKTSPFSVRRIREKVAAGQEHYETFLNYRRDGSPFMNLLMCAPLFDSRGKVKYFIGAQVDVSGLAKECVGLESLQRMVARERDEEETTQAVEKDEFRQLSEMLNVSELETVRQYGGAMHHLQQAKPAHVGTAGKSNSNWHKTRILINDENSSDEEIEQAGSQLSSSRLSNGRLAGIYENYLLVRPHPNLRILFASPSLRIPGILQSPLFSRIGGTSRVMAELGQAFADGTSVTARVRWMNKTGSDGRHRWIHCTPLLGSNGAVGVWMVVLVDEHDDSQDRLRRTAPPIASYGQQPGRYTPRTQRVDAAEDAASMHSSINDEPEMRRLARELYGQQMDKRRRRVLAMDGASCNGDGDLTPPDSPYTLDFGI